jgi:hypothetical protein
MDDLYNRMQCKVMEEMLHRSGISIESINQSINLIVTEGGLARKEMLRVAGLIIQASRSPLDSLWVTLYIYSVHTT